jgi:hypothetical protein
MTTQVRQNEVMVNTTGFEFAHGRRPSGFGSWAFEIGSSTTAGDLDNLFWVNQSLYSAARRAAVQEAARRGEYSVTVCS